MLCLHLIKLNLGHYLDENMVPRFTVVGAMPIVGDHTKENLAPMITEFLSEFGIANKKCHAIVRDGAMKATARMTGYSSIWCFAHVLNRVKFYKLTTLLDYFRPFLMESKP
jgi:hypothetical protein